MSRRRMQFALSISGLLISLSCLPQLNAQASAGAPDANLYISYYFGSGYRNVYWVVCGSTATTKGCYDSGSIGPLGKAGAMTESRYAAINSTTNTVTRDIYVVDIASGTSG